MSTAAELIEAGLRPATATERLRDAVLARLRAARAETGDHEEALHRLFPRTVLPLATLESLAAGLVAGNNILLLGPPGSGKTSLAKEVWDLMPKDIVAIAGSPVQDDPWSLLDPAYAKRVPPSPFAVAAHGRPGEVRPEDLPIVKTTLREGHGLARVQGSPEVFPDNLTGSVNLARLEEIGDPNSPLVLEPGKVLQAHRGLLMVDEVGKLPRGTQNVLLQALQERIVSPAKSRETFPADIVAITTSNVHDLANITEPLTDRLANVLVDFPTDAVSNRRIIDLALDVDVPGPYRDAAVRLVMRWRAKSDGHAELGEVGSNRTLLDIPRRAWSHAMLAGDGKVGKDDLRRGAHDAMTGRVRARSRDGFDAHRERIEAFLVSEFDDAAAEGASSSWCAFFDAELNGDKNQGTRLVKLLRGADALPDEPLAAKFAAHVRATQPGTDDAGVLRAFQALEDLGAFR